MQSWWMADIKDINHQFCWWFVCILKATILQSNFAKVYASSTIKLLI